MRIYTLGVWRSSGVCPLHFYFIGVLMQWVFFELKEKHVKESSKIQFRVSIPSCSARFQDGFFPVEFQDGFRR